MVASADVACASIGQGVFSGSPLCTLVVPNALLLHLHANKSGYVEGVNECIKGRMLTLSKTCARLETALQKIAGKLASKLKKCQGSRERSKVRSSHSNFLVGEGETISVQDVVEPLQVSVCLSVSLCVCCVLTTTLTRRG